MKENMDDPHHSPQIARAAGALWPRLVGTATVRIGSSHWRRCTVWRALDFCEGTEPYEISSGAGGKGGSQPRAAERVASQAPSQIHLLIATIRFSLLDTDNYRPSEVVIIQTNRNYG